MQIEPNEKEVANHSELLGKAFACERIGNEPN